MGVAAFVFDQKTDSDILNSFELEISAIIPARQISNRDSSIRINFRFQEVSATSALELVGDLFTNHGMRRTVHGGRDNHSP